MHRGPLLLLLALVGKPGDILPILGRLRVDAARRTRADQVDGFAFLWVHEFPLFERDATTGAYVPCHHLFSMPFEEDIQYLDSEPLRVSAHLYDLVCNGTELSSGAIRNHRPDVMRKAFAIAGYGDDVLDRQFGGMLRALSLGAPPHGGIAPGIDRIAMLLCGEENLREVVLFPMNQRAEDLMMGAPCEVTPRQLRELHIRLNLPTKTDRNEQP